MKKSELKLKIYEKIQKSDIAIDQDLFDYGYDIFNDYVLFIVVSIIIALIFENMNELLMFCIVFVPLRKNLGGFHLKNKSNCFIVSILIVLITINIIKAIVIKSFTIFLAGYIFVFFITIWLGCQSHVNKPLNDSEKKAYKNKALFYEMLYFAIGLISIKVDRYDLFSSIFFTSLLCSFDVIIQYIKMKNIKMKMVE